MNYNVDFHYVFKGMGNLLEGLQVTLVLTGSAVAIGLVFGFVLCQMAMSPYRALRWPASAFIEFFRCTPALIQIVWFFYCVPILFNVFLDPITMGILALGLNITAFNAEAYRASIQTIPVTHVQAGIALGLSPLQRTLYIILPQAVRKAVPVLITNSISTFQQSALVAIVAVSDLMYMGKTLSTQTYRPIETFTVVALMYFMISFPVTQLVSYIERRQEKNA